MRKRQTGKGESCWKRSGFDTVNDTRARGGGVVQGADSVSKSLLREAAWSSKPGFLGFSPLWELEGSLPPQPTAAATVQGMPMCPRGASALHTRSTTRLPGIFICCFLRQRLTHTGRLSVTWPFRAPEDRKLFLNPGKTGARPPLMLHTWEQELPRTHTHSCTLTPSRTLT